MTKKNGEVEFVWNSETRMARMVYIPATGKTIKFNVASKRAFTADPREIEFLTKLGYEALSVKKAGKKEKIVVEEPVIEEKTVEDQETVVPEEVVVEEVIDDATTGKDEAGIENEPVVKQKRSRKSRK